MPKSYYLCNRPLKVDGTDEGDEAKGELCHLNLSPGTKEMVEFPIDSTPSILRYANSLQLRLYLADTTGNDLI